MRFVIATLLVVISMANAEPSRFGPTSRQTASYKANNWKPQGTPFVLPQRQQQPSYNTPTFQNPSTKYGVPESQLSESNKRESIEVEDLKDSKKQNKPARLQRERQIAESNGAYYFLLPQTQLYAVQPLYTAKIQTFPTAASLSTLYQPFYNYANLKYI